MGKTQSASSHYAPSGRSANNDSHSGCSNRTLRGDYGILVSGVRALGPTVTERFIGTGIRTYDGRGNFHRLTNSRRRRDRAVSDRRPVGTYTVTPLLRTSTSLLPRCAPHRDVVRHRRSRRRGQRHRDVSAPEPRDGPADQSRPGVRAAVVARTLTSLIIGSRGLRRRHGSTRQTRTGNGSTGASRSCDILASRLAWWPCQSRAPLHFASALSNSMCRPTSCGTTAVPVELDDSRWTSLVLVVDSARSWSLDLTSSR